MSNVGVSILNTNVVISDINKKSFKTELPVKSPDIVLKDSDSSKIKDHKKGIPSSAIKIAAEVTLAVGNSLVHKPDAGVKVAANSSKFMTKTLPKTVGILNYAVGAYDTYDFSKKLINKDVSIKSKAFAGGTVALDIVTIVAHNKGSGKIAMAAGLLSIGTSVASDYFKNK